jgi:hypothetical protein
MVGEEERGRGEIKKSCVWCVWCVWCAGDAGAGGAFSLPTFFWNHNPSSRSWVMKVISESKFQVMLSPFVWS